MRGERQRGCVLSGARGCDGRGKLRTVRSHIDILTPLLGLLLREL